MNRNQIPPRQILKTPNRKDCSPLFVILLFACLGIAVAGRGTDFLYWGASAEGPAPQDNKGDSAPAS
jgi:hypothetical protein